MGAGGDAEARRGVGLVGGPGGLEGAHDGAVEEDPEVLTGAVVGPALGGQEVDPVGAGGGEGDGLGDGAGALEESDLGALGCVGVAAGESRGVGGKARSGVVALGGEGPGRPRGVVGEVAVADVDGLEAGVGEGRGGRGGGGVGVGVGGGGVVGLGDRAVEGVVGDGGRRSTAHLT